MKLTVKLIAGAAMLVAAGASFAQAGETVKMIRIDPLTGLLGPVGVSQIKGYQFFAEKFSGKGNPAGVIGGSTFLTEPAMAATVGSVIFVVVVVGGMGSLSGAFVASILIGVIQTFAVAFEYSLATLAQQIGLPLSDAVANNSYVKLTLSQVAPILPYLFLVLILIFRPRGLLGKREG